MLQTNKRSEQILYVFLAVWALINVIQASATGLHADEAYYWMYSRFLDWGYFDHPPMVALFIKIGDTLSRSTLGLRLITLITSTLSIYVLWKIVKPYADQILLFVILFSSIVLFHVYGFITTPDAPLFFFTVLFFYVYQRYERDDKLIWALLLAIVIACLLYSKYHGILILLFTILSNLKLLKRPSFWLIVCIALIAYIPHIWWQVQNGYPSFHYHVIDRSSNQYQFNFTYEYILAQLALAGPLVGWYLYRSAVSVKSSDGFLRALKFNFYGIFIFFLFATLKGRVEAHWTLPAMLCLFMLAYIALGKTTVPAWFKKLAIANIAMIAVVRLILIFPVPSLMKLGFVAYYYGNKEWARQIQDKAGHHPVVFMDSFQVPSWYNYYNSTTLGYGYDSRYYRKNQYDIWPLEDSLRNKKIYLVSSGRHGDEVQDTINTVKGAYYGRWITQARLYQKVKITPLDLPAVAEKGKAYQIKLQITNPYQEAISFGNTNAKWKCYLEYGFKKDDHPAQFSTLDGNNNFHILPGQAARVERTIVVPLTPGKYKLIFSIRTDPFSGSRNSSMIGITVN